MDHTTGGQDDTTFGGGSKEYNDGGSIPYILRSPEQIAGFFDGLELLEPGVASCSRWRPDAGAWGLPAEVHQYGGVALKR